MAKSLDFNSVQRPSLDLTMKDHTVIRVSAPRESLVEELQTVASELGEVVNAGKAEGIQAIFDLAARLISCNRDYITVTAEDLRGRYGMDLEDVILFFNAYLDFIGEISQAKN